MTEIAAKSSRKPKPLLRIVLDTNQLYTGSASDLLRHSLCDTIKQNQKHQDIVLAWYIPDPVLHERQYQMLEAATGLLPALEKLERLLGHNLAADRGSVCVWRPRQASR